MVLRYSASEKICYPDKYVQPYHILFAAVKYDKSILRSIFSSKEGLYHRLENYYINIGQLQKEKINNGVGYKLSRI